MTAHAHMHRVGRWPPLSCGHTTSCYSSFEQGIFIDSSVFRRTASVDAAGTGLIFMEIKRSNNGVREPLLQIRTQQMPLVR